MTGSLTPQSAGASDDLGTASYKVTGTGTANDAHRVPGVTLIDPTTGLPYAASGGSGGGGGAVTLIDGADVTQGISTDTSASTTIMGRLVKLIALFPTSIGQKLSAASLGVVIASDQSAIATNATVSGTVTSNDGGTAITGQALQSGGGGALGWLSQIYKVLAGTVTISGAVTNSNLDVALSTRLKPADTLAGVTTVGAVTAITNALPAGTNAIGSVGQKSQITATTTMQNAVTANGAGTVVTTDGYNGAILIFISNSTGTATVTIEGSLDSAFTTPQDVIPLGLYKLGDNTATNTSRAVVSGAIAVAASTSYLYAVADSFPYIRARISGQVSLAALTVKCYAVPS